MFGVRGDTNVLLDFEDDQMDWSVTIYANISLGSDGEFMVQNKDYHHQNINCTIINIVIFNILHFYNNNYY